MVGGGEEVFLTNGNRGRVVRPTESETLRFVEVFWIFVLRYRWGNRKGKKVSQM